MNYILAHSNSFDQSSNYGWDMMPHGWGMMGGSWLFRWIMIVISLLVVLLLGVIIRWLWIKGNQEKQ